MSDRDYAPQPQLPEWIRDFADNELKKNANIQDLFISDSRAAVEDVVNELRSRVGLDLVTGEEEFDQEKTSTKKEASCENRIQRMIALANALEDGGDAEGAMAVDEKVQELYAKDKKKKEEEDKEEGVLDKFPKVKLFVDNVCQSRQGHVSLPAILKMIEDERPEDIDVDSVDLREYIEKKIKDEKVDLPDSGDELAGINHLTVLVVTEEDDGNKEVFSKPPTQI